MMPPEQAEAYRDAVEAYNGGVDKEWLAFDAIRLARAAPHLPEVKALEAKLAMAVEALREIEEAGSKWTTCKNVPAMARATLAKIEGDK
jgi:hypothetical protein